MNFFVKKMKRVFNIIIGGKPKTITALDDAEEQELLDLSKQAASGDQEAFENIQKRLKSTKEDALTSDLKQEELNLEVAQKKADELAHKLQMQSSSMDILRESGLFTIEGSSIYLKGYKAEIPQILADKFASNLMNNLPVEPLVNFWNLALLLPNSEARRGLYNFITKQRLMVLPSGYFVGFRRLVSLNTSSDLKIKTAVSKVELEQFVAKAKRSHQSLRYYDIRRGVDGICFLQPKTTQRKKGTFVTCLKDEHTAHNVKGEAPVSGFTDSHTRTMHIQVGEVVRIPRSQCDSNSSITCSKGLHIGSETFVRSGAAFGDTIVACILSPAHVISVPYADAHKMRMCEYFPAFTLTEEEFATFDPESIDWTPYSRAYKKIEDTRAKKALEIIDRLTEEEKATFTSPQVSLDMKAEADENVYKASASVAALRRDLAISLEDDVSNALDFEELSRLLRKRIEK